MSNKNCSHCKKEMRSVGNGKIWLIIDERVCDLCWKKFLKEDREEHECRMSNEIDKAHGEKMAHIDKFLDWIKEEERKPRMTEAKVLTGKEDYIICWKCQKTMMRCHVCYSRKMETVDHILEEKPVCHWCWDKSMEEAVSQAGY